MVLIFTFNPVLPQNFYKLFLILNICKNILAVNLMQQVTYITDIQLLLLIHITKIVMYFSDNIWIFLEIALMLLYVWLVVEFSPQVWAIKTITLH